MHLTSIDTVEVLLREQDWYRRGVWGDIYIRANKPDLNRD